MKIVDVLEGGEPETFANFDADRQRWFPAWVLSITKRPSLSCRTLWRVPHDQATDPLCPVYRTMLFLQKRCLTTSFKQYWSSNAFWCKINVSLFYKCGIFRCISQLKVILKNFIQSNYKSKRKIHRKIRQITKQNGRKLLGKRQTKRNLDAAVLIGDREQLMRSQSKRVNIKDILDNHVCISFFVGWVLTFIAISLNFSVWNQVISVFFGESRTSFHVFHERKKKALKHETVAFFQGTYLLIE